MPFINQKNNLVGAFHATVEIAHGDRSHRDYCLEFLRTFVNNLSSSAE